MIEVEPRHHTARNYDRPTMGHVVEHVARAKGKSLMPWQRRAADVALEIDPATGVNAYGTVVLTVPRQAGKTKLESDVADATCLTRTAARVWLTMQNGKTADSWMREEHLPVLGRSPVFRSRFGKSLRAGEVGAKWFNDSTFYTFAPNRDALHSKQSDVVIVDEAWAHSRETGADLRQAIRPTMNTRPGAQLWIVSTLGDDSSEYLDGYIEMGRAAVGNPSSRVCFIDYGIGDEDDAEDLETILRHHPAYGHTITLQALQDAKEDFEGGPDKPPDPAGWARAYGNRATRTRLVAFPPGAWDAAGHQLVDVPPRAGISLDATPSGDRAALVAGWRDDTGAGFVDVLVAGRPSRELPQRIVDVCTARDAPLVVDRVASGALEIVDAVGRLAPKLEVQFLGTHVAVSAHTTFYRGVIDGTVHHFNDPDLDASVEVAARRPVGDGGHLWTRKGSTGSVCELIAATNALKGFDTLPAARRRAVARAGRR
jgi:hypothetical protein